MAPINTVLKDSPIDQTNLWVSSENKSTKHFTYFANLASIFIGLLQVREFKREVKITKINNMITVSKTHF